jgi:hypothetical protein
MLILQYARSLKIQGMFAVIGGYNHSNIKKHLGKRSRVRSISIEGCLVGLFNCPMILEGIISCFRGGRQAVKKISGEGFRSPAPKAGHLLSSAILRW